MNHLDSEPNEENSVFVEHASQEVQKSPQVAGNLDAAALLAEARSSIYHWPNDFPGFAAKLTFLESDRIWVGEIKARSSRKYDLLFDGDALEKSTQDWVRFQVEELLAHREAPETSKMASKTGMEFGENCEIYGPKLVFLGDKMAVSIASKRRKLPRSAGVMAVNGLQS